MFSSTQPLKVGHTSTLGQPRIPVAPSSHPLPNDHFCCGRLALLALGKELHDGSSRLLLAIVLAGEPCWMRVVASQTRLVTCQVHSVLPLGQIVSQSLGDTTMKSQGRRKHRSQLRTGMLAPLLTGCVACSKSPNFSPVTD